MKTLKRLLGDKGENLSIKYLKKLGHSILAQNYQRSWGEIDIVSIKDKEIHFVEVKTQTIDTRYSSVDAYEAEEKVDYKKRTRLRRIIQTYLLDKKLLEVDYCVDVLAVYLDREGNEVRIEYIEDIML